MEFISEGIFGKYKKITALLGHLIQNIFFALIKKIFLQTIVEIIFRYNFFLEFWDKIQTNKIIYIWGVGYQSI